MKDINYYLGLPYTVILRRDEEGDFVARIDELQGCTAHGKSPQEALENLEEAETLWIADCIESGESVPEPVVEESLPSGKWVQRVPKSLHRKLVSIAKREGVSLNQLVTSILAEAAGVRRGKEHGKSLVEKEAAASGSSIGAKGIPEGFFVDVPDYDRAGYVKVRTDEFSVVYLAVTGREVFEARLIRRSGIISFPAHEVADQIKSYLH